MNLPSTDLDSPAREPLVTSPDANAERWHRPGYGQYAINEEGMRDLVASARRHISPRRLRAWLPCIALWKTGPKALAAGFRRDDRLYPDWRSQPVRAPVFIFANARSGTTLLHRLMSYDEELWSSMRLYQSVFNSVSAQRGIEALARLDPHLPLQPFRRMVDAFNAKVFSGWDGIHKLGIDQYEEDETSFVICMNSITLNLFVPFTDELPRLRFLDRLEDDYRERFADFYEATIKRHLYASAPDRRFLSKNVFLTPRVRTIHARFPDARFIHLTRHPYEAIPSFLSMWFEKWATHSPELRRDGPEVRALFDMAVDYSLYALELRRHLPAGSLYDMRYEDLVDHPGRAVEEVYDWLGEEMSPAFRLNVAEATAQQRLHDSDHDYELEAFGLSKAEILDRLEPVFEAYGFHR